MSPTLFENLLVNLKINNMSLYNMLNGVNPATFFILPMLGEKHPEEYPRFKNCFVNTYATYIFSVPNEWKGDFEKIKDGKLKETFDKLFETKVN